MADPGTASFLTRANALLRKNLTYQKRNIWSNVRLIMIPFFLCLILVAFQILFDTVVNNSDDNRCGCQCILTNQNGNCLNKTCGIEFSTSDQAFFCSMSSPPRWPPLLQVPRPESRAVNATFLPDMGLPDETCRRKGTCPVTILFTGNNHSLGASLLRNLLPSSVTVNTSDPLQGLAYNVLGTEIESELTNYLDPGISSNLSIYNIQSSCNSNATFPLLSFGDEPLNFQRELTCAQGLNLWRNNSREVNDVLFKGYRKGNFEGKTNEIAAAYDLLNTDRNNFNVHIWYNSTYNNSTDDRPLRLLRVPGLVNLVSNAYLHFLQGPGTKMLFEYVKEVPKLESRLRLDIASLIGPLFFTWVILLLFPVILSSLVYEKQEHLRIIMKMHGLGDGPYWMITYAYFLSISMLYFICLIIFGSAIGLNFFRLNDYSIQFTFYFLYVNLQIALCSLVSSIFSKVKTSTVVSYIYVFLSGLVGTFLLQFLIEDSSFSRGWIIVLELFPPFSLYRGLYEFGEFAFRGNLRGGDGMKWKDFSDSAMDELFIIIIVEWFLALIAAYYIDKIVSSGKDPLFFFKSLLKKSPSMRRPSLQRQGSKVVVEMEKPDVNQEIEKVEQLMLEPSTSHAIVCDNLKKVYPSRDGNPPKLAVRGLSLAVPSGECFGMLGPNGAGKSSFINVMTGLLKPTSGTALIRGLDICNDMDRVYTSMGVCPQHDLLWETLTGREHLLFYGRLKNLRGSELKQAVEESLKSVNLFHGGVADKPAGKYSGGMKRRLSVAISLIGNPKVVYMDEPSTGLDPASRKNLWTVIKRAKQNTAIILTTHSMEEAEFLCDRLGIFVDGSLQCIGNPKELKGRYGGSYVFTMTTSSEHEGNVEKLIQDVSPSAKKIYHIAGTQKFELPKEEVRISEVFEAVEKAKSNFTVFAWGLADTTLEDVFIKVARTGQAFNVFS
ncbi:ABC transporter A family member 7 [Raphanus sativus]|uniref:ABC transporter A family member 7 n=1 Tax=Raphanus sativus TaxID=3726 RepID=A0A6J0JP84_RAPSA|nr:ABC transporter A family member 7 [Raphanus sativus]